jgi:tRNA nucleotidyltransferase (CCA-adding enzyme)
VSERELGPLAPLLGSLARIARTTGRDAYLVGGAVRDFMLHRPPVDVDIALEGPVHAASSFVTAVSAEAGWSVEARHDRFGTATLRGPNGKRIDVAATREERYPHPGALPVVKAGVPVARDLARRDFTIHAMAFRLSEEGIEKTLHDPFGGERDIDRRCLRLLHEESLADDPTRVFRAARYSARLGFEIDPGIVEALRRGVASGSFVRISGDRLRRALQEALSEQNRDVAVEILGRLGVFHSIVEGWSVPVSVARDLSEVPGPVEALVRLMSPVDPALRERIASRLNFSRALRRAVGCAR